MHFFIVGNPENRRVNAFVESVCGSGTGRVTLISYLDVLRSGFPALKDEGRAVFRIESPGENMEVRSLLIAKGRIVAGEKQLLETRAGGATEWSDLSEIAHTRLWYLGFRALLEELADWLRQFPQLRVMNRPEDIALMFDKVACQRHLQAAGVPVPDFCSGVLSYKALLEVMEEKRWRKVFIKPAHTSSASGVIAFRKSGGRSQIVSSVELSQKDGDVRLYNSLKIRTYQDSSDIQTIIDRILQEGAIVEQWLSKATLGEHFFDLRILVISGRARHLVVRKSKQVITNLHLGNARGTYEELEQTIGATSIDEARQAAVRAANCFPSSLYCGVDVLVGEGSKEIRVLEVNAFGDLLPNLWHEGQSCYEAEIEAITQNLVQI